MSLRPRELADSWPDAGPAAVSSVWVDRLVVRGLRLNRADAERLRVALASELTALLSEVGVGALALGVGEPPVVRFRESDTPEEMARALAAGLTGAGTEGGTPCGSG